MSKARGLADLGNVYDDGALSNRNLIINGAMTVAQRGTTASAAAGCVSLDRYSAFASGGGAWTLSQETDTPSGQGFKNSAKVTVNTADTSIAAGDYYIFQHRIEGQNIAHFMQGTSDAIEVTLSFWVKSSLTGDFGGSFGNGDADRSYPFQYNIATANTWQKITKTVQLDTSGTWLTTNGVGLKVNLDLGSGTTFQGSADAWATGNYLTAPSSVQLIGTSAATWYITGVQLEVGDTATPFEHRSFGDELARCQRYFSKISALRSYFYAPVASAGKIDSLIFSPQMRASPIVTPTQLASVNTLSFLILAINNDKLEMYHRGTAAGHADYQFSLALSADL